MNFQGGVSSNIATFGIGKEGNLSTTPKDVCFFSLPISCILFSFFCQVHIALSLWLYGWKGKSYSVYVWYVQFTGNGK